MKYEENIKLSLKIIYSTAKSLILKYKNVSIYKCNFTNKFLHPSHVHNRKEF